jgi:putative transposase
MIKRYRTDITDKQWAIIEPLIPPAKDGGRPRTVDMREVVNACFYISRSGCQWDLIPKDFPPRTTVFEYYSQWSKDGTFDEILRALREEIRIKAGRNKKPTAAIIDSQTVKTAGAHLDVGYDGGKKIKGRKRHIAVDVLGLLLMVIVHSAGIQDRAGGKLLMTKLMSFFNGIKIVWVDGGYSGKSLKEWVKMVFNVVWQVVKRPRKVFKIVKFRWIVERTFGWLNYHRRLSKDYEYLPQHSEGWVKIASINMMIHSLCPG